MNPRPPGYEPGELPDCSTPRRWPELYHRYDPRISLLTGISLLIFVVALVGSLAVLVVRALRTWRAFRSFGRAATTALDDVARAGSATEARAAAMTERTERLTQAVEHLQHSLERLAILRAATNEFRSDFLFSYRPTPGTVLFFGYGASLTEPDAFRFQNLRRTSDGFFLKASYLFRM